VDLWQWFSNLSSATWAIVSSIITALATVALAYLTFVLARATRAMADSSHQPHVVVTFEINQWGIRFLDMVVENCGNSPAYDVEISIDPMLPSSELRDEGGQPFDKISLLRPSQKLVSSASDWDAVKDIEFAVNVSWRRSPKTKHRETLSYKYDMRYLRNISFLGSQNPEVQIATEVKKIRENWSSIAAGTRRLKVEASFPENIPDRKAKAPATPTSLE